MVYLKNSDNFMLNTIAENKKVNLAASSFRLVFLNLSYEDQGTKNDGEKSYKFSLIKNNYKEHDRISFVK